MISVVFAVLSGVSYGAADFSGALATKRNDSSLVTLVVQAVSLASLVVVIAVSVDGTVIASDLIWGAIGGIGAAIALTTFYAALAEGPMSTAASVTALVGSLVPVLTGLALGEVPNRMTLIGIALAIPAAIVVSVGAAGVRETRVARSPRASARARSRAGRTRGLSIIAGLGFGLFFVALAQTSADGGLYPLVGARVASVLLMAGVLTNQGTWAMIHRSDWLAVIIAGLLDCAANSLYLLALVDGSFTWVAAVVSLYPVATVLLARVILRELITKAQVVGLAMAAGALVLVGMGAT